MPKNVKSGHAAGRKSIRDPAPKRGRKKAAKKKANARRTRSELQTALLQAAYKLFSDRGYPSVTTREITEEAGVALPVLYRFFRDKRALYVECYFQLQRRTMSHMEAGVAHFTDPIEVLFAFTLRLSEDGVDFQASKIFHRVLLDRDMPILRRLAKIFFTSPLSKKVLEAASKLAGKEKGFVKMLSIYSLVAGAIEHAPFWNLSPGHQWHIKDAGAIATYVLETIFPEVKTWADAASRVAKKLSIASSPQ